MESTWTLSAACWAWVSSARLETGWRVSMGWVNLRRSRRRDSSDSVG